MRQADEEPVEQNGEQQVVDSLRSRPYLRLLVVSLWSSFIGACLFLAALLAHMLYASESPTLGQQSIFFFTAWLISLVPAAIAAVLIMPPPGSGESHDG